MQTTVYDAGKDPLFGRPECLLFPEQFCVQDCEFGIAGPCWRARSGGGAKTDAELEIEDWIETL